MEHHVSEHRIGEHEQQHLLDTIPTLQTHKPIDKKELKGKSNHLLKSSVAFQRS